MNRRAIFTAALVAVTAAVGADAASAQMPEHLRDYPLAQLRPSGDVIAPFFDGWFANPDGSVTYEFGYMNRNTEEVVDIPLGENNKLELRYADGTVVPAEVDGIQPTRFYVYDRPGFSGKRERGTFAVTVDDPSTEVVWTLAHAQHSYSVPGRATSTAYELSWGKTAFGSLRPALRFSPTSPESRGAEGPWATPVMASVGTPVTLSALVQDRGERYGLTEKLWVPVRAEFIIHQGPAGAEATFDPPRVTVEPGVEASGGEGAAVGQAQWGEVSTQATFTEPGEYVIRVRADNFAAEDSGFDYVCCWANGYIPVTVR